MTNPIFLDKTFDFPKDVNSWLAVARARAFKTISKQCQLEKSCNYTQLAQKARKSLSYTFFSPQIVRKTVKLLQRNDVFFDIPSNVISRRATDRITQNFPLYDNIPNVSCLSMQNPQALLSVPARNIGILRQFVSESFRGGKKKRALFITIDRSVTAPAAARSLGQDR